MKLWVNRYLLGTWIEWWIKSLPSWGISNWRDRPNKQNSSLSKPINTWNNYKVWEVLWRKQRTKRKCGTPLVWSLLSEEMTKKRRSEDKKRVIERWKEHPRQRKCMCKGPEVGKTEFLRLWMKNSVDHWVVIQGLSGGKKRLAQWKTILCMVLRARNLDFSPNTKGFKLYLLCEQRKQI